MTVLDVRGLSVRYHTDDGPLNAVRDVSLSVASAEAVAIVGESGSGKSTIAAAILDLLGPGAEVTGGTIDFEGRDLTRLSRTERRGVLGRRIGSVFQDPFTSLNPSQRVGDQIAEPLMQHQGIGRSEALERARQLMSELGISRTNDVAAAYPHQLSGGMKQRALLAAALICGPSLLVLDEPTTALDVTIEAQILDLLTALREQRRLSLLFISHNLAVVRRLCDMVYVLYAGQVVERAAVDALFEAPVHPYTKGLLASLPRIRIGAAERLASIPGGLPNLVTVPNGCSFVPRCPFAEDPCRLEAQSLAEVGPGRLARCRRGARIVHMAWPRADEAARSAPCALNGGLVTADGLSKSFRIGSVWDRLKIGRSPDGRLALGRERELAAVDRVTLEIKRGEVLGLVGESGCGKTTLGRCLIRLVDPTSGTITFDGRDITTDSRWALRGFRRDAQIIFQNPDSSLNPRLTVAQIVGRPLALFDMAEPRQMAQRVGELLEMARLPQSYGRRYPHQLSGGEKQRVGIARALASRPKFIVCDEAVSALDVSVQAAIVNLLAELRVELGLAMLFISHDLSVVTHIADRIAVMYQGRICEIGPTHSVLSPPYHPYTQALLSAVPQLAAGGAGGTRIPLAGEVGGGAPAPTRCVFERRCQMKLGDRCEHEAPDAIDAAPGHRIFCHHEIGTLRKMRSVVGAAADQERSRTAVKV